MKEKEIENKIEELQKQLREKEKKREKKVLVNESILNSVLYILISIILLLALDNVLSFYNPSATILSMIGSLAIIFGLSWFFMVLIKCVFFKYKKK